MTEHLIKLSVGTTGVNDLAAWQKTPQACGPDGLPRHVTRMWPKRADQIAGQGSIYWVIDGLIRCRQRILRFDEVIREDGIRRCAIVLEPELIRTAQVRKRPFQGWRYLAGADAPPDLMAGQGADDALPADLQAALADIGVL